MERRPLNAPAPDWQTVLEISDYIGCQDTLASMASTHPGIQQVQAPGGVGSFVQVVGEGHNNAGNGSLQTYIVLGEGSAAANSLLQPTLLRHALQQQAVSQQQMAQPVMQQRPLTQQLVPLQQMFQQLVSVQIQPPQPAQPRGAVPLHFAHMGSVTTGAMLGEVAGRSAIGNGLSLGTPLRIVDDTPSQGSSSVSHFAEKSTTDFVARDSPEGSVGGRRPKPLDLRDPRQRHIARKRQASCNSSQRTRCKLLNTLDRLLEVLDIPSGKSVEEGLSLCVGKMAEMVKDGRMDPEYHVKKRGMDPEYHVKKRGRMSAPGDGTSSASSDASNNRPSLSDNGASDGGSCASSAYVHASSSSTGGSANLASSAYVHASSSSTGGSANQAIAPPGCGVVAQTPQDRGRALQRENRLYQQHQQRLQQQQEPRRQEAPTEHSGCAQSDWDAWMTSFVEDDTAQGKPMEDEPERDGSTTPPWPGGADSIDGRSAEDEDMIEEYKNDLAVLSDQRSHIQRAFDRLGSGETAAPARDDLRKILNRMDDELTRLRGLLAARQGQTDALAA